MSYSKNGFPVEQASKIGQLRIIHDPVLQSVLGSFETSGAGAGAPLVSVTGHVDLKAAAAIRRIVAIDGGEAVIPNPIRRERALGFVAAAALVLRMEDYERLSDDPMADPRDINKQMENRLWYKAAAIPLSGVSMPGMSVRETMRAVVNSTLSAANTGLIETLRFLVYREWMPYWPVGEEPPSMRCLHCSVPFDLPYAAHASSFGCPKCGYQHYLSDYMGICEIADDFGRETSVSNLRNVLEVLILFDVIRKYRHQREEIGKTLFLKDGPLMLRAQLARLVQPIRAFLTDLHVDGIDLHIVGVEKNGGLVSLVDEFKESLPTPGDYFLPSVKFLVEEVSGNEMPPDYRNRVSFGAKVAVRLGPHHVVVLTVPTGQFLLNPRPQDLFGLDQSVRVLSKLTSFRYPNALVPLVLANSMASIAQRPSNTILETFASNLMGNA